LASEQQQILAPLSDDWDNFEPQRKRNWIGIAKRYPNMKPDEQVRVQRRMQAWAKLTPKERDAARALQENGEIAPGEERGAEGAMGRVQPPSRAGKAQAGKHAAQTFRGGAEGQASSGRLP